MNNTATYWKSVIDSITSALHLNTLKTIEEIAAECMIPEHTVRNFIQLTNCKEVVVKGMPGYTLNSAPKKIKMRQAVLLVMELEKRTNETEWLSTQQIKDSMAILFKEIDADKAVQQMWALHNGGTVDRKGLRPNYLYRIRDSSDKKVIVAMRAGKSITEQLMELIETVERIEMRNKELEEENKVLTKKLAVYERHAKSMAQAMED